MLKIAVSRCLLGEAVRYDGSAKPCEQLSLLNQIDTEIVAFCPEVSIGMGVPRLPIQLDLVDGDVLARRKENVAYDYTKPLSEYAQTFARQYPDLVAVINKKSSPSCGYQTTKLYQSGELIHQQASGIFIEKLKQLLPGLYVIDEEMLGNSRQREEFVTWLKQKSPT